MHELKQLERILFCLCLASGSVLNVGAYSFDSHAVPASFHFRKYFRPSFDSDEAKILALEAVSGQVTKVTLVKEMGGSGIHYMVIIDHKGTLNEVDVDAVTGKIHKIVPETPPLPGSDSLVLHN